MSFIQFLNTYYKMTAKDFIKLDYHEKTPIVYDFKRMKNKAE